MDPPLYDDLEGQVVLVTGANRGTGREIARGLVHLDATVVAGVRDEAYDVPGGTTAVELDVTDEAAIRAAVEEVISSFDRPDVLVNNAGVGDSDTGLAALETERLDRILSVNLRGRCCCRNTRSPISSTRMVGGSSTSPPASDRSPGRATARCRPTGFPKRGSTPRPSRSTERTGTKGCSPTPSPRGVATGMGGQEAPLTPEEGAETPVWLTRFRPGSPSGLFWSDKEVIDY